MHEQAISEGRRDEPLTLTHLGWTFVVPAEVYAPHRTASDSPIVLAEARAHDRVLGLGTGSGVNVIARRDVVRKSWRWTSTP